MFQLVMALCILIFPSLVTAYQMSGRVLRVDNGNTVTIVDSNNVQHTVRLQDIQAPGLNKPKGIQSRRNLQEMIGGRHVIIDYDPSRGYQSPTGRIYLGNTDVNLKQIEGGMAKFQSSGLPIDEKLEERYQTAQEQAKTEKRGIWYESPKTAESPKYERRLMTPNELKPYARGNYPPLTQRQHFIYRTGPEDSSQVIGGNADQYAPLPDRRRMFYGYRDTGSKVPSEAVNEQISVPKKKRTVPPQGLAPRFRFMAPPFAPAIPYWAYPPRFPSK